MENFHDAQQNMRGLFRETVETALRCTCHPAFASIRNDILIKTLASWASRTVSDSLLQNDDVASISAPLDFVDFRLWLDIIARSPNSETTETLRRLCDIESDPTQYYVDWLEEVASTDFGAATRDEICVVGDLERLLGDVRHDDLQVTQIFAPPGSAFEPAHIAEFAANLIGIPFCLDLLGVNSLVRKGLMKLLPFNGRVFVTKKGNPDKPGRFQNDLAAAVRLRTKHSDVTRSFFVPLVSGGGSNVIEASFLCPDMIVRNRVDGSFYSVTEYRDGETLEQVLLRLPLGDVVRLQHLRNARGMLNRLYQSGIVWGDFAPRNIIFRPSKLGAWSYLLLDFEKTSFHDRPVPHSDRIEHCRGPMCVEEFGAVCTLDEVVDTFSPYFDPSSWPTDSTDPIPFAKPKREIMDILTGAPDSRPTFGAYNRVELEVFTARFPFPANLAGLNTRYICRLRWTITLATCTIRCSLRF